MSAQGADEDTPNNTRQRVTQGQRRTALVTLLAAYEQALVDARAPKGQIKDIQAIAQAVAGGDNDPARGHVGCDSDLGANISGFVSTLMSHTW